MRYLSKIALAAGVALALPSSALAWTGFTTTALNLRTSAGGPVLTRMPPGAPVEVVGSCGGPWYQVFFAGYRGCAHSAYITTQMVYSPTPYPPAYFYPGPLYPYGWSGARIGLGIGLLGLALHAAHGPRWWHWD
jgi:uncharacterized protein YraI